MKHFLPVEAQDQLIKALVDSGMESQTAHRFATVPDDMNEVDLAMAAHAASITICKKLGKELQAEQGLACLMSLMVEAMNRGLGEHDFPLALSIVKESLEQLNGVKTVLN